LDISKLTETRFGNTGVFFATSKDISPESLELEIVGQVAYGAAGLTDHIERAVRKE
jgi:hypothetical protein